jgi:hypothetical protein
MSPEVKELLDKLMTAAADPEDNAIDVEIAAQAAFAFMAWSLSNILDDRRDYLVALFATQLPERIAVLLRERGRDVQFASVQ